MPYPLVWLQAGAEAVGFQRAVLAEAVPHEQLLAVAAPAKMGVIVLSNFAEANPSARAYEMVDLLLRDKSIKNPLATQALADSSMAKLADAAAFQGFTGDYYASDGARFGYFLKNGKLYWKSPVAEYLLAKVGKSTFSTLHLDPSRRSKFVFTNGADGMVKAEQTWATGERTLTRVSATKLDAAAQAKLLQEYAGSYYSPELEYSYTLAVKGQKLVISDSRTSDATLELLEKDIFLVSGVIFNMKRNKQHIITHMEVSTGRVKHLTFDRVQPPKAKPKTVVQTSRGLKKAVVKPVGS